MGHSKAAHSTFPVTWRADGSRLPLNPEWPPKQRRGPAVGQRSATSRGGHETCGSSTLASDMAEQRRPYTRPRSNTSRSTSSRSEQRTTRRRRIASIGGFMARPRPGMRAAMPGTRTVHRAPPGRKASDIRLAQTPRRFPTPAHRLRPRRRLLLRRAALPRARGLVAADGHLARRRQRPALHADHLLRDLPLPWPPRRRNQPPIPASQAIAAAAKALDASAPTGSTRPTPRGGRAARSAR